MIPDDTWLTLLEQEKRKYIDMFIEDNEEEMIEIAQSRTEFLDGHDDENPVNTDDIMMIGDRVSRVDRSEYQKILSDKEDEETEELARAYLGTEILKEIVDGE